MHPTDVVMPLSDQEFSSKIAGERQLLAGLAIGLTVADLYAQGYSALIPVDKSGKYSLVADLRERGLKRVFVQVAAIGQPAVTLGRISYRLHESDWGADEISEPRYQGTEFDILAMVDRVTRGVFYIPTPEIDFRKARLYIKEADRDRLQRI